MQRQIITARSTLLTLLTFLMSTNILMQAGADLLAPTETKSEATAQLNLGMFATESEKHVGTCTLPRIDLKHCPKDNRTVT
jgi:hypothetical protein